MEVLDKKYYEYSKPEFRLDEQDKTPNYKTINSFRFDENASYFHVMKREQKKNDSGYQESLQGIVELKKVDGKMVASYLRYGSKKGKNTAKKEGRSVDPRGIPDSLRLIVQEKSKEIDMIPGNMSQSTTVDILADKETVVSDIQQKLGALYQEISQETKNQ